MIPLGNDDRRRPVTARPAADGFDYHDGSIDSARKAAVEAGVSDRVNFEVASAKECEGSDFNLLCFFDCLHDMGDPVGAASHARRALLADGTLLLVEPYANEKLEENCNR